MFGNIKILDNEIFKPVYKWEGLYSVSNFGRVVCHKRKWKPSPSINKQILGNHGYMVVTLKHGKRSATYTVHSLIARAFINNRYTEAGYVCDHIDGNKVNNSLSNIRVITQRENCFNKKRSNLLGAVYHSRDKKWTASVRSNGGRKYLGYYETEREAHDAFMAETSKHIPMEAWRQR